jgi:hypothetical protein
VLYLLGAVVGFTTVIGTLAVLFTGKYPRGLWNLALMYFRWQANVFAYLGMMRDEYPPFSEGPYPVVYNIDYPEHLSRWKWLFKWLLAIPHFIALAILGIGVYVVVFIAWLAIIFTGHYPRGMFNFVVGVMRWAQRVMTYLYLMTDAYPPFSME